MTAEDQSLAKSFEPAAIEAKWGPEWERRGIAQPTFDANRPDFAIQLPPSGVAAGPPVVQAVAVRAPDQQHGGAAKP